MSAPQMSADVHFYTVVMLFYKTLLYAVVLNARILGLSTNKIKVNFSVM